MKTLRQMRIEQLINQCDDQMEVLLGNVETIKNCTMNGQYRPKVGIRLYREIMERVAVLNRRTWLLTNNETDYKRKYSITSFSEYIEFFEL